MDIEFSENTSNLFSFFNPIAHFPISTLYQGHITLENTFGSVPNIHENDILLTLIDKTLLISNPLHAHIQPYAALSLNFDVKF